MNTDDEFHLYIGATRYYLGRMTYAVDDFVRTLVRNWSTLSEQTRSIICRDIEEQFELDDVAQPGGLGGGGQGGGPSLGNNGTNGGENTGGGGGGAQTFPGVGSTGGGSGEVS